MSPSQSYHALLLMGREACQRSSTPQLDAELLLSDAVGSTRATLHAWPEREATEAQATRYHSLIAQRAKGVPIAYLRGYQAFWQGELLVSPATLIPRPATECLVEQILAYAPQQEVLHVADLGTGSGAIALALASERPKWQVVATDCSAEALAVAERNAARWCLKQVTFYQGHWCAALPHKQFDIIACNPPYIDPQSTYLQQGDVRFEPRTALVADDAGWADLYAVVQAAKHYLRPQGLLCLEHGFDQADKLQRHMKSQGYDIKHTYRDLEGHPRGVIAVLHQ